MCAHRELATWNPDHSFWRRSGWPRGVLDRGCKRRRSAGIAGADGLLAPSAGPRRPHQAREKIIKARERDERHQFERVRFEGGGDAIRARLARTFLMCLVDGRFYSVPRRLARVSPSIVSPSRADTLPVREKRLQMTPDEFRAAGHRIVDWIADYRATVESRPVMAQTAPGEIKASLPIAPPRQPEAIRRHLSRHRLHRRRRAHQLAASALLRLFPLEWPARQRARRLPQHGPRRHRASPGNRVRRSPSSRRSSPTGCARCSACRRAWSGVIQDTASTSTLVALLCARERTTGLLPGRGGLAGRSAAARRLCRRRTVTARSKRRRCWPDSAATTCASSRTTRSTRCAPRRSSTLIERDLAAGRGRAPIVATTGTTTTTALDPLAAIAPGRTRARAVAARRRGDGGLGDDPARMPLDVGRRRARRLAGRQPAQVARVRRSTARSTTSATPSISSA